MQRNRPAVVTTEDAQRAALAAEADALRKRLDQLERNQRLGALAKRADAMRGAR